MDLTDPLAGIAPSVHTRLLIHLWHQDSSTSGRALARAMAPYATRPTVQEALRDLVAVGVVVAADRPPAVLYGLNRNHVATRAVAELADLRRSVWVRITSDLEEWPARPLGVYLFGSSARGEAVAGSDVDLLVIYDNVKDANRAEAHQTTLGLRITSWSGNRSQIVGMTMSELAAADHAGQSLVAELQRDAVALDGPRLRSLLHQARKAYPESR